MSKFDAVVIGGGINGLTAACALSKRGKKVLLLEKRKSFGGRADGVLFDTSNLWKDVADHLSLQKYGLEFESEHEIYFAEKDADGLLISTDLEKTQKEISKFSKKDAENYPKYLSYHKRMRPFMDKLICDGPVDILDVGFQDLFRLGKVGLALRGLGKKDMIEFLRVAPMCLGDYLGENFETDLLKAGLCFPAVIGSYTGPWSPGNTLNLLMEESLRHQPVKGGAKALTQALVSAAKDLGVEMRAETEVKEILLDKAVVQSVLLASGEKIETSFVLSSLDPKRTFFNLINNACLDFQFENRLTHYRMRGTSSVLQLKTKTPLRFKKRPQLDWKQARIGEKLDEIEKAFDAVKYGECSEKPVFELYQDESSVSALVHFTPYQLKEGWTDAKREELQGKLMNQLSDYFIDLDSSVESVRLFTPLDLETEYGLTEGQIFHGEVAIDQFLVRPIPEVADYKTPFKGLYLCGSGSYPGGGLTMGPGILGAKTALKHS